jgi:hypothetical protein
MPLFKALPAGTIVGDTDTQTLTGKTIDSASNTITGKQLVGTTTNDNASAGNIGEFVSATVATGSAVSLTTSVAANITSISLTAGDWDVEGVVQFNHGATTTMNTLQGCVHTTTATNTGEPSPTSLSGAHWAGNGAAVDANAKPSINIARTRFSLSGTTTVFLNCFAIFGTSTLSAYGFIAARRVR